MLALTSSNGWRAPGSLHVVGIEKNVRAGFGRDGTQRVGQRLLRQIELIDALPVRHARRQYQGWNEGARIPKTMGHRSPRNSGSARR